MGLEWGGPQWNPSFTQTSYLVKRGSEWRKEECSASSENSLCIQHMRFSIWSVWEFGTIEKLMNEVQNVFSVMGICTNRRIKCSLQSSVHFWRQVLKQDQYLGENDKAGICWMIFTEDIYWFLRKSLRKIVWKHNIEDTFHACHFKQLCTVHLNICLH